MRRASASRQREPPDPAHPVGQQARDGCRGHPPTQPHEHPHRDDREADRRSSRAAATCSRRADPTARPARGCASTPQRPSCVKRSHTMWLTTPSAQRDDEQQHPPPRARASAAAPGRGSRTPSVSRSARAAPAIPLRRQSRGEPARRELTRRPGAARTATRAAAPARARIVAGSHAKIVRAAVVQRQPAHEQRQVRRHRADRDRGRHERRAHERQRDDRVARGERHRSLVCRRDGRAATTRQPTNTPGERLLAAPEHRHPPGQRARHAAASSSTFAPSSDTPPCAIARRPSDEARDEAGVDERLHDRRAGRRPWRSAAPRARCRSVVGVERGQVALPEERLGCRDHGGRGIRPVHEGGDLEREALLRGAAERLGRDEPLVLLDLGAREEREDLEARR